MLVLTTVVFVSQGGEGRTELYIYVECQLKFFGFTELYVYPSELYHITGVRTCVQKVKPKIAEMNRAIRRQS